MPVNLTAPEAQSLLPVRGVKLGAAEANVRKPNRKDVLVMQLAPGSKVAGVFTQNRFCAAPVTLCKAHLATGKEVRALLVNTGNANAGTGEPGLQHARQSCEALAALLGCESEQILPFSTGVIMEPLPVDRIIHGLPQCIDDLHEDRWLRAAETIMTTDIVAKGASRQISIDGKTLTITGISKGSGMIHPNMATMLGYIATDAAVSQSALDSIIRHAVNRSFNCITVDGDTSTNDACVVLASGCSGAPEIFPGSEHLAAFSAALASVCKRLAELIIRDGEGATKLMRIIVEQARDSGEALQVAKTIAHSPLVKTAFFASDPNWGRILAAVGRAGVENMELEKIEIYLGTVCIVENGGRAPSYTEQDGQRVMSQQEIDVTVRLGRGTASEQVLTCDFSYDYVKINAEYRT